METKSREQKLFFWNEIETLKICFIFYHLIKSTSFFLYCFKKSVKWIKTFQICSHSFSYPYNIASILEIMSLLGSSSCVKPSSTWSLVLGKERSECWGFCFLRFHRKWLACPSLDHGCQCSSPLCRWLLLCPAIGYRQRWGIHWLARQWHLCLIHWKGHLSCDRLGETLTSILIICSKLNVSSEKSGCVLSWMCPFNPYINHGVSHLFLSYPGSRDSVFFFTWSWLLNVFLDSFMHLLLCFYFTVQSTECFFVQSFCVYANNHFDRKILTPNSIFLLMTEAILKFAIELIQNLEKYFPFIISFLSYWDEIISNI